MWTRNGTRSTRRLRTRSRQLRSIEPNYQTAKLNRDNLLWKTGCADKVIARQDKQKRQHTTILDSYNRAIEKDPDNYVTWFNRGNILMQMERYEEATNSYTKAIG